MDYKQRFSQWLELADEQTRLELQTLTESEIEDRFYTELAFGTAGLRGILGAGTNRMNEYVVRRATLGLSNYLLKIPNAKQRGVAIAYDSRNFSSEFALTCALVLAKNGLKAYLFESIRAVPQLSFALRHLGCVAGVVITASHNPAIYNGYKVYWEDGGQVAPEQANAILCEIEKCEYFKIQQMSKIEALDSGLLQIIGKDVDEAYYASTMSLLLNPKLVREKGNSLSVVYTPLHGAGNIPVREILNRIGVSNVHVVPEQELPNGNFPTVSAPNPEDPDAFTLATKLANKVGADTILATDPDSDRLGVAVRKKDGSFKVLTGNQIGCLLLEYILSSKASAGLLPQNALVVKSLVSTRLADEICAHYNVKLDSVLTGFRFISEKIENSIRTKAHTFLFGFEESFGFLAGTFSRDKDAICTAMLVAEICVVYAARGKTLDDAVQELYDKYGYFKESVKNYTLNGIEGLESINRAMRGLRTEIPSELAGISVTVFEDYESRSSLLLASNNKQPLELPSSNMVRLLFENGAWMVVRPSGTEPKLKLYIGANAKDESQVDILLAKMMESADQLLCGYLFGQEE
ncbi:phospho-sugar mutase [Eubacteriales bacterium OttesenSCG-928-K08]|nr:phospho-sugar mutase [Eubacteriales bacterium OttesenSCG-928-K08]